LIVRQAENADASNAGELLVLQPVRLGIVARAVDLDDEVVVGQIEIDDAIRRIREGLLEPIGNPDGVEVTAELVLGRRPVSPELLDVDSVPSPERDLRGRHHIP